MWDFELPDLTIPTLDFGPPLPPLLRLPPAIRRRIYQYTGLASPDGKSLPFDLGGNQPGSSIPRLRTPWRGFRGLLLCCRLIHDEAVELLYSANRFSLYYCWTTGPRSLDPLLALTGPALAALSNLKIVLNQSSCHEAHQEHRFSMKCCNSTQHEARCTYHRGVHHTALLGNKGPKRREIDRMLGRGRLEGFPRHSLDEVKRMLRAWHAAAAVLSETSPGRLELGLVCDIDAERSRAVHVARSVVVPLQTLPRSHLRSCHLRLSPTPDPRLQRLARDTVLHACDLTPPSAAPQDGVPWLTQLPAEVRIRILQYTDLVAPGMEITWRRDNNQHRYSASQPTHRDRCWHNQASHGCFCHCHHGAFSPLCRCWKPPGPDLFLICRTLTRDARFVFFSCNRFVIYDLSRTCPWKLGVLGNSATILDGGRDPYTHARLAISEFLREAVPPAAVSHLRRLEMSFHESIPSNWPGTDHPAMQDWRETVEWLRGKLGAHSLALSLYVHKVGLEQSHSYWDHEHIPDEAKPVLQAFDDLVRPLRGLVDDGLTDFTVHLDFPMPLPGRSCGRTPGTKGYYALQHDGTKALEERAMRLALGDKYGA